MFLAVQLQVASQTLIYSATLTVTEEANNNNKKIQERFEMKPFFSYLACTAGLQYATVSAHHNMCAQFQHFNWFIPGNSIMTTVIT